jgi:hypothetical protein
MCIAKVKQSELKVMILWGLLLFLCYASANSAAVQQDFRVSFIGYLDLKEL